MSKTVKKHFVFDLDDTLVDGRLFCGETMARCISKFEPKLDRQAIIDHHEKIRGRTIVELYESAIAKFNVRAPIKDLLELDSKIMTSEFDKIRIFEGVVDILDLLKARGKTLHICTNRKAESLLPILKSNNIHSYFDSVISCIDKGTKKPNPQCLLELIEKSGDSIDSFIYFGDSEIDYQFAVNAGMEYIIFDQYLNGKNLFKKLIDLFLE